MLTRQNDKYLQEIKLKVIYLMEELQMLRNEVNQLKNEKEKLKKEIVEKQQSIEILEEKNKIAKLAEGIHLSKQDMKSVKTEINRQLREIDECIRLLNQ
jgi:regulator of replication initiation timing